MKYYVLVPEVAGHFGADTVFIDRNARPPLIERLHYEFDGWLGDSILETICCYIVTESTREKILAFRPTGVTFAEVKVTKSTEFVARYPDRVLPAFAWLQIIGVAGKDDFGYTKTHGSSMVVSSRILDVLSESGIPHCAVVELANWRGGETAILERLHQWELKNPPPVEE